MLYYTGRFVQAALCGLHLNKYFKTDNEEKTDFQPFWAEQGLFRFG